MPLIICGDCKKKYSDFAKECPECARPTISQEKAKEKLEVQEDKKYKSNISRFMKSFIEKKIYCINKLKVVENDVLRRSFLKEFKPTPMLTIEEELFLEKQVQEYIQIDRAEIELIELTGKKPNIDDLSFKLDLTNLQIKKRLQTGERAMIKLLRANLRLVASIAWGYRGYKKICEFNEVLKGGVIGLVRAVETFDSAGEYSFSRYAYYRIVLEIQDLIAEKVRFANKGNFLNRSNIPVEKFDDLTFPFHIWHHLSFSEGLVLRLRYNSDKEKKMSFSSVGQVLGISDLAVKAIEEKAWKQLKDIALIKTKNLS